MCDPAEVQAVKAALDADPANLGLGVHHVPSGRTHLCPIDALPDHGGHVGLVDALGLPPSECRGFIVVKAGAAYQAVNSSHLNGTQGAAGSLKMPAETFNDIVKELHDAGL